MTHSEARARAARSNAARVRPAYHAEPLESRLLLTTALSFDSVPRGYAAAGFSPGVQAVGDFNADGIPDIVTSSADYSNQVFTLKTLLGNGDGNFHLGGTLVVPHPAVDLAVGDFDRNGKLDVVALQTDGNGLTTYFGTGDGRIFHGQFYEYNIQVNRPDQVIVRDLDGDTKLDIAFSSGSGSCQLLLGNGLGTFETLPEAGGEGTPPEVKTFVFRQSAIQAADVNGDGKVDIVTTDISATDTQVHVSLAKGGGFFYASQTFPTTLPADKIVIADMNLDGKLDLVMAEGGFQGFVGVVKFGHGDGTFGPDLQLQQSFWAQNVGVGDFDGDFNMDIAFSASKLGNEERTKSVYFRRGDGHGNFGPEESRLISDGDDPSYISVADFNRDGRPDIAASLFHTAASVYTLINTAPLQNSIQGRVYNDDNKNQVDDVGEADLPGRTVFDDVNDNGVPDPGEQTAVTYADGTYNLAVPDGNHRIRTVLPPAWLQTTPPPQLSSSLPSALLVTVSGHQTRSGQYFGTYFRGTISGTLWNDSNANGVRDVFEDANIPLQRTLYIDANDNGVPDAGEATALTDAAGVYRFILPPGDYRVRQVLPTGWLQTYPYTPMGAARTGAYHLVIGPGQVSINQDFGSTRLGGISGRVFYDVKADRISDDSDPGRSGFKVFVDGNFNGAFDAGELFTFTDSTGHYGFANLYPGKYAVGVVKPAGWVQTTPTANLGTFHTDVFGGGGDVGGYVDFGLIYPSYVSGRVFNDLNGDGIQAAGENGLAGFGVFVDVSGTGYGSFSDPATQTDALGNYTLRVPVDGTYNVRVTRPSGWQSTVPSSNAHSVVFANASTVTGQNFGLKQGAFNNAGFLNPVNFPASQFSFVNPAGVATGDFNLDTRQDFVVANNSGDVTLFTGNGAGGFTRTSVGFGGSGKRTVITAFLNADTFPDLVTANQDDGTVSVFLGNGNGTFQTSHDYTAAPGAYCVVAAEFTGDGAIDLAVGGVSGTQVVLLPGNGAGAFAAPVDVGASAGTYAIATGDFDNDQKKDLAWVNQNTDTVIVRRGNGNGTFQTPLTITTGINQPGSIALGDFNKDTFLDLAVVNAFSDVVRVITGVGNGSFNAGVNYGTGSTPSQVTTLDVDRDGWLDLAVAYKSDGTTEISGGINLLRNHGDGTFEAALTSTAHTSPNSVATADFNGDALPDLVATNFFGDDVSVMINSRSPSAAVSGVVFDDRNGDGAKGADEGFAAGRVVYLDLSGNGSLDAGEPTATTDAAGSFVFPPVVAGQYTVRLVVDAGYAQTLPAAGAGVVVSAIPGGSASATFGGRDVAPPGVFDARFLPDAPAMAVRLVFTEDVGSTLTAADLQLVNRTTGATIPSTDLVVSYDARSYVAMVTFGGAAAAAARGALPDGDYRLTLAAGSVADRSGNALGDVTTVDFFVLAADANHDRNVDFNDLVVLAQNYNTAAKTFATGDFNYDGNVDFNDLVLLAQRYNTSLVAPPAASPAPATTTAVRTRTAFAVRAVIRAAPVAKPLNTSARRGKHRPV